MAQPLSKAIRVYYYNFREFCTNNRFIFCVLLIFDVFLHVNVLRRNINPMQIEVPEGIEIKE